MNHEKELLKNTLILSIGQLVPKLLAVITLPILTSQLATSEYGEYDLALTLSSFLLPLITLQIHQAVFRELLNCSDLQRRKNIEKTSILFTTTLGIVIMMAVGIILYFNNVAIIHIVITSVYIVCESVYTLVGQLVRGNGKNLIYSKGAIVYSVINTVSLLTLQAYHQLTAFSAVACIVLGYLTAIIYFKINLAKLGTYKGHGRFDFLELKGLLNFSIPIVPSALALWIVNLSDRLIVTAFLGTSMNGVYSVANKIPNIYNSTYSIFTMAWIESASKVADEGNPDAYYSSLFKKLFDFLTGVMLIVVAALPVVFSLLVNKNYDAAYNQIIFLFWGAYFNSFVSFYGGVYIAIKRTKSAAASSFMGAVLNLLINLAFINTIGLYAASVSTALSFGIITLFRAIDMRKYVNINYQWKKIGIGALTFATVSVLAFQRNIILDIVILIIAVLYNWINRYLYMDMINKVLNKMKH